ncbi:type II toxin-antitoxin system YafQ family toxin [candidate division KSB1 bacterium]
MRIHYTSQFKKDYKRIKKQGKNPELLRQVIELLLQDNPLPPRYKDHRLIGVWRNHRDCHIEPDWILIYRIKEEVLILERTGSHSELY